MSVLTKNNYIKANALMSYTDIASADVEVLQQTATDMGYDEFAQATNGDLLLKKTEVVGSYTYVTTFNCRTEDVSVTVTESPKIVFADPDVKAIVANAFGTDGEITEEQAAAVTTWFSGTDSSTNPFFRNKNINSFDEFAYFTGVTEIGSSAFEMCEMTSITLPSRVTYIGDYAFWSCSSLGSVTIPENVTAIGNRVFDGCTLLESMNIPAAVTSIGERVFNNCLNLTYISVDANNSYFNDGNGSNAIIDNNGNLLYGGRACTVIPNTVNSIGDYAFHNRNFLNNTLIIPSSVTSIGTGAFYLCINLTSLTIPASVTSIGPSAFYNCYRMTNLTIGNSVTSIGNSAFESCDNLTRVICEATTPPTLGTEVFDYTNNCPIYVPSASLDAYKTAWSNYANRIQAIAESENE